MRSPATVRRFGDAGLLIELRHDDREVSWRHAQAMADELWRHRPEGVVDLVASFDSVFVAYDPLATDFETLSAAVEISATAEGAVAEPRTFHLPVVYGGEFGPDLVDVAAEQGVSTDEMVRLHSARRWIVRFRGAPAGSPMLDGGSWQTPIARCASPRPRVAPGSVAVSGRQSVVYAVPSPGGWRLIGRTPITLVDARKPEIAPYRPGDLLTFVPVPADSWTGWEGALHDLADELTHALGPR